MNHWKISIIDLGHKGIIWSIRLSAPMENILLVLIGNMKKMDLCYTIFNTLYIVGDIERGGEDIMLALKETFKEISTNKKGCTT